MDVDNGDNGGPGNEIFGNAGMSIPDMEERALEEHANAEEEFENNKEDSKPAPKPPAPKFHGARDRVSYNLSPFHSASPFSHCCLNCSVFLPF